MKKIAKKIAFGFSIFLGLIVLFLLIEHVRGKISLNAYKKELIAKGEILSAKDLAPIHTPEAERLTKLFFNASKQLKTDDTALGWQVPEIPQMMKIVSPGRARVLWAEKDLRLDECTNTWANLGIHLQKAEGSLKSAREALNKPALTEGLDYQKHFPRSDSGHSLAKRCMAQYLAISAINELHHGKRDAALKNIQALSSLALLHQNDALLISLLLRANINELNVIVLWEALQSPAWNDSQLMALQQELQKQKLLEIVPRVLEMERAGMILVFNDLRENYFESEPGWNLWDFVFNIDRILGLPWKIAYLDQDELFHLKDQQTLLDTIRSSTTHKSWSQLKPQLETQSAKFEETFSGNLGSYNRWRFYLSSFQSSFISHPRKIMMAETGREMAMTAVALKRYQLRKGKLASNLEALIPEFLSESPTDYMDGKPLRYRLNQDGSFLLYSVGTDGKDDGGDPTPSKTTEPYYHPLWYGRDAVWPLPVKK
jgi:hypothetical protein